MASTIKVDKIEGSTGSTITVPTGQTFTVTDGMAVAGGGTGLTSFTTGDVLYASGATTLTKLAKGTAEQVLSMNSGETAPEWATAAPTAGGTGQTAWATGDLLYANGTNTLTKLTKPGSTMNLQMTSAGVPSWVAAPTSDVVALGRIQETSGATIDVDGLFTSDYDYYRLVVNNWVMSSAWKTYLRVMVGGSSNTDTSYNRTIFRSYTDTTPSNSVTAYGDYDSVDFWEAMGGDSGSNSNTTSGAVFGWFDIYKPLNTTQWKHVVYQYGHASEGTTFQNQFGHLMWKNTAAISGLRLYSDITTITDFDATLYGYKPGS